MTAVAALRSQTFSSLYNPNYRKYFSGQAISLIGTWMQRVAQSWLVLQLTGSGTVLGLVVALQTVPVLVLAPYGGVVADRLDKRRLMIVLQAMMGVLALILGLLTVGGAVRTWHVVVLAFCLGMASCFENPARQSFVLELVGADHVRNAVSLNSVLVNAARAIGPAAAGLIIAAGGLGICFLINAASFGAVVASLVRLDVSRLQPSARAARSRGQLREGLAYVWHTPTLAVTLVMMGLIGCIAYEFQVVLPILADDTFGGNAQAYGFMTAAMGTGAVIGGLYVAARGRTGVPPLVGSAVLFGVFMVAAAVAPSLWTELLALALVGAASIRLMAMGNSTLQLAADPSMRGRVMSLWAVAFLGTTPIGGPIVGAISEHSGGRVGLLVGAAACLAAAGVGAVATRRLKLHSLERPGPAAQPGKERPTAAPAATPPSPPGTAPPVPAAGTAPAATPGTAAAAPSGTAAVPAPAPPPASGPTRPSAIVARGSAAAPAGPDEPAPPSIRPSAAPGGSPPA